MEVTRLGSDSPRAILIRLKELETCDRRRLLGALIQSRWLQTLLDGRGSATSQEA